mmetsp:Transcript_14495/g.41762  ORF Transcript_14495/g.41762 Transcript_14495/m.41762 type:complete len:242 (+) Transcript_14495:3-728(+)
MLLERKGKMKTAGESSVPRAASKPPLVRPHATFRPPPGASREELERFIDILVEQILDLRKDNADLMEMLKKDMENQEDLRRDKEDMRRDMRKDKEMLWKVIEDLGKDKDYLRNELKRERAFSLKLSKKAATRCAVRRASSFLSVLSFCRPLRLVSSKAVPPTVRSSRKTPSSGGASSSAAAVPSSVQLLEPSSTAARSAYSARLPNRAAASHQPATKLRPTRRNMTEDSLTVPLLEEDAQV